MTTVVDYCTVVAVVRREKVGLPCFTGFIALSRFRVFMFWFVVLPVIGDLTRFAGLCRVFEVYIRLSVSEQGTSVLGCRHNTICERTEGRLETG